MGMKIIVEPASKIPLKAAVKAMSMTVKGKQFRNAAVT